MLKQINNKVPVITVNREKIIFLIDGSSFLYRAYYGVRSLHTPQGLPVQAVFSFCRMIKKVIDNFDPYFMVIVWDSKGKTTRHHLYEQYKATRQEPPTDIFDQKMLIIEFAQLVGIKQVEITGIEADDIMFSIAQEQKKEDYTVVMITSDKDMLQALDAHTVIYDPLKDLVVDSEIVEEKYGFAIERLPFYYALMGDASDNIPGVHGIGAKRATRLVQQFESLESLYDTIDLVDNSRIKNALLTEKESAFLSRDLFLLHYHQSQVTREQMRFEANRWVDAYPFFKKLNFKTLLPPEVAVYDEQQKKRCVDLYAFTLILKERDLDALCVKIAETKEFALDTETDGIDPLQATCVGISICLYEGEAWYIPFGQKEHDVQQSLLSPKQKNSDRILNTQRIIERLKPFLEDEQYKKYFHNAKFDLLVLQVLGIEVRGIALDTMIAARLITKEWQRIGLKDLSSYYFDETMISFKEVVTDAGFDHFGQVPLDKAVQYAAADAHQTFRLAQLLQKELVNASFSNLYYAIEHPLIDVLVAMEFAGVSLDISVLKRLNHQMSEELIILERGINDIVGNKYESLNLNSSKQIEQLLFVDLGLPPQKKSAKGSRYSTDQEVLIALLNLHPVVGLILRYRELFKLKSTYIDGLIPYVNKKTKRVHTTYSQVAVATGRLSSSYPNLQNIPIGTGGYGGEIRAAFKPKQGHLFLSADYSQIELRVLAYLSQDERLVDAFLKGADIHQETAAHIFDITAACVTYDQRQIGKRINFSILYGLTPYGLAKDLGISFASAKEYINRYFERYQGVRRWMDAVVEQAKIDGYVTTVWGRRRYIAGINEKNPALYKEAIRIAINTVAQGTAAEIVKIGMIRLHDRFKKSVGSPAILLQIHDELLISVEREYVQEVEKITKHILESVVDWSIPFVVSTRIGNNWKEVTK